MLDIAVKGKASRQLKSDVEAGFNKLESARSQLCVMSTYQIAVLGNQGCVVNDRMGGVPLTLRLLLGIVAVGSFLLPGLLLSHTPGSRPPPRIPCGMWHTS